MNYKYKVSVALLTYNHEKYIDKKTSAFWC